MSRGEKGREESALLLGCHRLLFPERTKAGILPMRSGRNASARKGYLCRPPVLLAPMALFLFTDVDNPHNYAIFLSYAGLCLLTSITMAIVRRHLTKVPTATLMHSLLKMRLTAICSIVILRAGQAETEGT